MKGFYFVANTYRLRSVVLKSMLDIISDNSKFGVLFNYAMIKRKSFFENTMRYCHDLGVNVLVDNGAFYILQGYITVEDYIKFIEKYVDFVKYFLKFDNVIFVLPDIPLDARFKGSIELNKRILLTVEMQKYFIKKLGYSEQFMRVVQGYNPHDYIKCLNMLEENDIIFEKTGIGSLCIRKYTVENYKRVKSIIDSLRTRIKWIHTFGLALNFLYRLGTLIDSSDSGAWSYIIQKNQKIVKHTRDTRTRNVITLKYYMKKVNKLFLQDNIIIRYLK